jgi:hypothetical protein
MTPWGESNNDLVLSLGVEQNQFLVEQVAEKEKEEEEESP